MNPELYEIIMEKLFEAGAIDVYMTPIIMKKNRPANKLSVLGKFVDLETLSEIILRETTTFGIRHYSVERIILDRMFKTVQTSYGPVPLKYGILDGEILKATPEYEVCKELSKKQNVPVMKVYNAALQAGEIIEIK